MTEREIRNAKMKHQIRQLAESCSDFIDIMELEIQERERMNADLAAEIDRLRREQEQNRAA